MKVLCFGSLNYDHIYQMDRFVMPKETLASLSYERSFGGKGLNQSIALKKAGLETYQAGKAGYDGQALIDYLQAYGVNTDHILKDDHTATGHAIIQICNAENTIIVYGGANTEITEADIDMILDPFRRDDILLTQNETSCIPYLLDKAKEKGMKIFFNIAPFTEEVFSYPLCKADMIIVNEHEGKALARVNDMNYEDIILRLGRAYPDTGIILTAGKDGAYYIKGETLIFQKAYPVKAKDTTGAGDTFTGYFLASLIRGKDIQEALRTAAKAASITVQGTGAAPSIPEWKDVERLQDIDQQNGIYKNRSINDENTEDNTIKTDKREV